MLVLIIIAIPGEIDFMRLLLIILLLFFFSWELVQYLKYVKALIQTFLLPEYAILFKPYKGEIDLKSYLILYLQQIKLKQAAAPAIIKAIVSIIILFLLSIVGPMALQ